MNIEIPTFLDRRNNKGNSMTAPAAEKAPKKKRQDCYTARLTVQIPVSLTDADSVPEATLAVKELQAHLPAGTVVDVVSTSFGKMAAE